MSNDLLYQEIRALRAELSALRDALQTDVRGIEAKLEARIQAVENRIWLVGVLSGVGGLGGGAALQFMGM